MATTGDPFSLEGRSKSLELRQILEPEASRRCWWEDGGCIDWQVADHRTLGGAHVHQEYLQEIENCIFGRFYVLLQAGTMPCTRNFCP